MNSYNFEALPAHKDLQNRAVEKAKLAVFCDGAILAPEEESALIDFLGRALARGEFPADCLRHPVTRLVNRIRKPLIRLGKPTSYPRIQCPCIKCWEKRRMARRRRPPLRQRPATENAPVGARRKLNARL